MKSKKKGGKKMTDEQLQRGSTLKDAIKRKQTELAHARGTLNIDARHPETFTHRQIPIDEAATMAIQAIIVTALERQLKALQEEYEAL